MNIQETEKEVLRIVDKTLTEYEIDGLDLTARRLLGIFYMKGKKESLRMDLIRSLATIIPSLLTQIAINFVFGFVGHMVYGWAGVFWALYAIILSNTVLAILYRNKTDA